MYGQLLRDHWDTMKNNNIHITGGPEGEKSQGLRRLFEEITTENFSNLVKKKTNKKTQSPGRIESP